MGIRDRVYSLQLIAIVMTKFKTIDFRAIMALVNWERPARRIDVYKRQVIHDMTMWIVRVVMPDATAWQVG